MLYYSNTPDAKRNAVRNTGMALYSCQPQPLEISHCIIFRFHLLVIFIICPNSFYLLPLHFAIKFCLAFELFAPGFAVV